MNLEQREELESKAPEEKKEAPKAPEMPADKVSAPAEGKEALSLDK